MYEEKSIIKYIWKMYTTCKSISIKIIIKLKNSFIDGCVAFFIPSLSVDRSTIVCIQSN